MSDEESDRIVYVGNIPTIRDLYADGDMENSPTLPSYPASDPLLDKISMIKGDITAVASDCIVNAANNSLLGGGGVDGAIHRAAGRGLLAECSGLNGCETGSAKITKGYNLPALHVIHAAGPVYFAHNGQQAARQLASCYQTCMELAVKYSLLTISFPSISTGVYGYPIEEATHVALDTVRKFLETKDGSKIDRVVFVVFSDKDKSVYEALIPRYFPFVDRLNPNSG